MSAKERAAFLSILATVVITLAKGITGWMTGSLALLSDAASSLLDVAATTVTFLVVRAADQPADDKHPYGHGKFESVAALGQTVLLCALSGIVAFEGLRRLLAGDARVETSMAAFIVLIAAIAVDAWRWHALRKAARETRSEALAADALHFSSDLVNSGLVLLALTAAAFGYPQADPLVAIGVALFIGVAGWRLGRRTLDSLVDAAPRDLSERVTTRVADVAGVVDVESVRMRRSGGSVLGEVGVRVARSLPLERVAEIKANISEAIARDAPEAQVVITANPVALDDETIRERILIIAARRHLPVHHVTIQHLGEKLSISLDLEVDGAMPLGAAHQLASSLEDSIRRELGQSLEVETHIEPLEPDGWAGVDADDSLRRRVAEILARLAGETADIGDVHSVRVRRIDAGLVVNFHCRVDPALPVSAMHAGVDEIEYGLRAAMTEIHRVIGHAEPRR